MNRNVVVIVVVILVVTGMLVAGKYLARRGANAPASIVQGGPAPEFALPTLEGQTLRLSELRGKAVLVNFWATWCGPCKVEMPWFVELQKQYGPQGLQIVGVALDDSGKDKIAEFAKEVGVNYPVVVGTDKVGDDYGVQALPTTVYLGRDGKIVSRTYGLVSHREIEKNIQTALKSGQAVDSQNAAGGVGK